MLRKLIAASTPPVSVARAKERLNIDSSDFDNDLERLILAAAAAVESHTGRIVGRSSWEYRLDYWPGPHPIQIPAFPVRDVTEVVYLAETTGLETVILEANWYWDRTPEGADLRFISDYSYPSLYNRPGSLIVRFDAGYDDPGESGSEDDPELTPDPRVEIAVLFLVGTWFAQRESVLAAQAYEVPDTFKYLANQLRIFR